MLLYCHPKTLNYLRACLYWHVLMEAIVKLCNTYLKENQIDVIELHSFGIMNFMKMIDQYL